MTDFSNFLSWSLPLLPPLVNKIKKPIGIVKNQLWMVSWSPPSRRCHPHSNRRVLSARTNERNLATGDKEQGTGWDQEVWARSELKYINNAVFLFYDKLCHCSAQDNNKMRNITDARIKTILHLIDGVDGNIIRTTSPSPHHQLHRHRSWARTKPFTFFGVPGRRENSSYHWFVPLLPQLAS